MGRSLATKTDRKMLAWLLRQPPLKWPIQRIASALRMSKRDVTIWHSEMLQLGHREIEDAFGASKGRKLKLNECAPLKEGYDRYRDETDGL